MALSGGVSRFKPYSVAIALIVVLLTFVAAGASYLFWKSYADTERAAANRAASASQVVSANVGWAFETARQVLRRVDDSLGPDLSAPSPDSASRLADAIATLPGSVKVYVVDAAGVTRLTTDAQYKPIDVRDREYFSAVRKGEQWHVSSLLVSRLNGEQIFTVSKRVERNGVFAGAAILSFNSDLMEGVWKSLSLDQKSTVGLVRNDGQLVSRYPLPNGPLDLSQYVLFTDYLSKAPSGTYDAISPADGISRIVSYQRIPGTELIALSSISTEEAFASFISGVTALLAFVVPAALALVTVTLWTFRLLQQDAQRREREAEFRTFAEAMPNHVWTAQPNGLLDWFNSRVYEYSGEEEGALDGAAWTRILHPDDIDEASRRWVSSLSSEQPYEAEFRIRHRDGAFRWHLARAVPITDKTSGTIRWIGTNTDIDDQKKISHQLAESEARMRLAIEAGQLAVWEIDVPSLHITPSPELNRLYGFPADAQPTIAEYQSRYAPGEKERVAQLSEESAARGDMELEVEVRHLWPDGTEKWLLIRAQTGPFQQGDATRVIGVVIDITARKHAEQALQQSERRFRLSQQAAGIASLELDIATGTVLGSDHFWEIWGLSPRESVHISVLEGIVIPDDKAIRSTPETRKSGTALPNVEYRIRRPDNGELRWLSRHIEFVHDKAGTPLKMFGIMRDITEQKEAEIRQQMLTHELEHRIKNILAMVSAIATQTMKNVDVDTARDTFNERLRGLGRAHDILTNTRWTATSMTEVLEASISPLPRSRVSVKGPELALQPNMALSMALGVHELGTNALKYGALSGTDGRVEVNWKLQAAVNGNKPTLNWTWQEYDGPVVTEPSRRGFGSQLITRVLAADFGGTVEIDYHPAGIRVSLTAPFLAY